MKGDMGMDVLEAVPDLVDIGGATRWFEERRAVLRGLEASPAVLASFRATEVGRALGEAAPPFGLYADATFRKLVLAVLLADWACYEAPVDQIHFDRLLHVMHVFPAGFRVWWAEVPGVGWLPVGYTGWIPISAVTFEVLETRAGELQNRALPVLPALEAGAEAEGSYVYLFNYSIVAGLRGTECSRRLLRGLADDVGAVRLRGMAAITVSEDGARVAERFGMRRSGVMVVEGVPEHVYSRRW